MGAGVVIAAMAMVVSACSSSGGSSGTPPATQSAAPPATQTQPAASGGSGSAPAPAGSSTAGGNGPLSLDVNTQNTGYTAPTQAPQTDCKPGQYSASHPITAAFIYVGSPTDAGWTQANDNGRKMAVKFFGDKLKTITKENVPEGPQTAQVIKQVINQGANIVFSTSFGFQDATVAAAKANPKVLFEMATGNVMLPNMAEYYGAGEDATYLAGMAAGAASKSGKLGFVVPFPIPENVRETNAFTLGAQRTHPGASVRVVFTNTWFDPAKERQAAQSLVTAGVDALGDFQDSPSTGQVAKANNLPWVGYDSDQESFAPDSWLTGTIYNWGPYFTHEIGAAMNCTWRSHFYYGSFKDNFVQLAPFGKRVPASVKPKIAKVKSEIEAGTFNPFSGPIKDQSGQVKVPKGSTLNVKQLYEINWFVNGVIGKLPKS